MKRGFKADAERQSTSLRATLNLRPIDPLPARRLAGHLGYQVCAPEVIGGMPIPIADWLSCPDCGWSACVLSDDQVKLILYNSSMSVGRQESSLMHELAHLICEHPSSALDLKGGLSLRRFVKDHEDEAAWLGGCLQLPRQALSHHVRQRRTATQVAEHFSASVEMVTFRYRMSGLQRQLGSRGW